jgi:hypothetical protein
MELIGITASQKADTAKSVSSNVASQVLAAFSSVVLGKGDDGLTDMNRRIYNSMRNKLFLKYIGADYEVLLTGMMRNDKLQPALEGE